MGAAGQGKTETRPKRAGKAAPAGERAEAPAPASGGGQKAKAKAQNPRQGTIAFTSKTTPQASCGAYIKNAPRGFLPQSACYSGLIILMVLAYELNLSGK